MHTSDGRYSLHKPKPMTLVAKAVQRRIHQSHNYWRLKTQYTYWGFGQIHEGRDVASSTKQELTRSGGAG